MRRELGWWAVAGAALLGALGTVLAADDGTVRVGGRAAIVLARGEGSLDAVERAEIATRRLGDLLLDPDCDPGAFKVEPQGELALVIGCGRTVLAANPADAEAEGGTVAGVAERWRAALQRAFAEEKAAVYGERLFERGLLGLLYPVVLIAALGLVRLAWRRVHDRLTAPHRGARGIRFGRYVLLGSVAERQFAAQVATVLQWFLYLLLVYGFLVAALKQFPRTAFAGGKLLAPALQFGTRVAEAITDLVPRLIVALLLVLAARLVLRRLSAYFDAIRAGRRQVGRVLSRDNATPVELTAKGMLAGVLLFLLALLVPGEARNIPLAAFALLGLALAIGAREVVSDLVTGVAVAFQRQIRTGDWVRTGRFSGRVAAKGLLQVRLRADDGRRIVVPNRWLFDQPVEVEGREAALRLRVVVESPNGVEAAQGLVRHAAVHAGLDRGAGTVRLDEVRGGLLVLDVRWPVAGEAARPDQVAAFLEGLLLRAKGFSIRVVDAEHRAQLDA